MTLLPQQHLMVDFLHAHPFAALWVDAGLGKTLAVLVWLDHLLAGGEINGALVVAPKRVATVTWPVEVERWFPWMKVADLRTKAGMDLWRSNGAQVYLINYEQVPKLCAATPEWPVQTLVLDEIHYAKNHASVRMKPLLKARSNFTRIVGMTGTPLGNGYIDLFAPMRLIDGGERLGEYVTHYRERYFDLDYLGYTYHLKDWAKEVIQQRVADITLVLRAEQYLKIPPVTVQDEEVPLNATDLRLYKKLQKEMLVEVQKQGEIVGVNAAALVGKLIQFTSGYAYGDTKQVIRVHTAKIDALRSLLQEHDEPTLVVTHYVHERDAILASVARWNRGDIKVLVVDPRSGGVGLNLQDGGRRVVWYSQTYSRLAYDQMNARVARTGQTKPVFIHRLLCPGTVDWAVVEALENKGAEQEELKTTIQALKRL